MTEERCTLCGTDEDSHYDGVQCPLFNGTYSSTQKFTTDPHSQLAPSELDTCCNSCGKPMIFHTRFATWVCKLFTRLEGIPATYVAKPVFVRKSVDNPIEPDELQELKQGPCGRRP